MIELDTTMPEGLTTGPVDRARDAWLQRTIANSGRHLAHIRDKVFELAQIQRHHLVLDLKTGSGLFTWEAIRSAPEGGVWSIAGDPQVGEALRQQAEQLSHLERPVVLIGEIAELEEMLDLRGESDVLFDCIVGRNAFTRNIGWSKIVERLSSGMREGGRIALAQVVPQHSQRLYKLCDSSSLPAAVVDRVGEAEEKIYVNSKDSLVNWDEDTLLLVLQEAGFENVRITSELQVESRRITDDHLDRWFGENGSDEAGERPTYAMRLAAGGLDEEEIGQVKDAYRMQMRNQIVKWTSTMIFVAGKR
jgi:putative ATPase